jgi:hypothetical protein
VAKFGDFPTQDEMPSGGGGLGLLAYHQLTVSQNGPASSFLDNLTITATVTAGKLYRVHWCSSWVLGATTDTRYVVLKVGGADVYRLGLITGMGAGHLAATGLYIPSTSGSKVFTVNLELSGTSILNLLGAAQVPRQLWIEAV